MLFLYKVILYWISSASWLEGQSFWLLTMRSRVRFSVLPWEFSLTGEDPRSEHGLGSLQNLGLRPILVLHAHTYHHSHHQGNVTVPCGRPNLRRRLHFGHNQEGRPQSPYGHVMALEIKYCIFAEYCVGYSDNIIPVPDTKHETIVLWLSTQGNVCV
jgi:hypothetical protein